MVNLLRWRLEHELGYQLTARIPMRMPSGMPIYDMLFATDHPVGDKIMTHLYRSAAEREPRMRQDAKAQSMKQARRESSEECALFDLDPATHPSREPGVGADRLMGSCQPSVVVSGLLGDRS